MSPRGQAASRTAGPCGSATGRNDQNRRSDSVGGPDRSPAAAAPPAGHTAPPLTHAVRAATCAGVSVLSGGMARSPSRRTAFTSRLSSGFPGTTAGPLSPPLRTNSRASSRSPPSCFFGPWHRWHSATKSGRTSRSNA